MRTLHIECKAVIHIIISRFELVSASALEHHCDIERALEAKFLSVVEEHAAQKVVLVY
jgi:hypothetical protein